MKRLWYYIAIFIVLIPGFCGLADQVPGSQYFFLGNGISYFPLGGSGVADFMRMEANLYNPAAYADTKRITTDLSVGGFGGDNFLLNFRTSFPANIGVISANVLTLTSPSGVTAGDIFWAKGTFSKEISEEWFFGAGVNAGYASGGPEQELMASLDFGTIYQKSVDGTGFGIYDHSLGLAFRNLGKNISYSGFDTFAPITVDFGGQAEFVRQGFYRAKLNGHVGLGLNQLNLYYGAGVENIFFDIFNLKAGLNFGIEDIFPLSIGADLYLDIRDTDVQLSYSLIQTDFFDTDDYVHNAGISVAFGTYDKKPPRALIQAEDIFFSPNHDGVSDRAKLDMDIKDNTMVFGWELVLSDQEGKPVKNFEAQDVRKIRKMTIGKYFNRIFSKKQEVEIPDFIEWDGEDAEGNIVPDGEYYYTLTVWDENNNKTVTPRGNLIIDTVVPIVEATADELLFSPNNDGAKDTLAISINSANIEPDDRVVKTITDKDGNIVFQERRAGIVDDRFVWDGRNQAGAVVDEGLYTFAITAFDNGGNRTFSAVEGMIVKTEYEKISASPTLRAFSPNGDGYADINDIKLFSSSKEGLIGWDLAILDQNNDVVRAYGGEKDFSDTISFDGKYTDGRVLPDGLYSVRFRLLYDTGNHPEAFFKFVRVDNTSPEISLSTNITAFSPNGDGVKDTMSIVHEIASEEEDVFEAKILNAAGATFKTFKYGSVPPETVVWDGMGDNNTQPVEGVYTYRITGKDSVGNYKSAEIGPIKLATGFEEVSVEPNFFVFSPEGDGTKDTVSFSLNTTSKEGVIEWKFDIRDRDGRLVRTYNDKNMGIDLPPEVIWDGQNDAETVVPNGIYTATLTMLYDTGNNPISKPKDVKLDTQPPVIEIVVEELNISPNDDGAKETLTIYQNIRGGEDDTYIGEIADFSRNVVRRFEWKGNPPVEIVWDGRNEQGIPLPEGLYTYTVSGQDAAGNRESQTISNIVLTTTYETVSLTASEEGISPNNDGFFENMELQSSISSVANLEAWRLILVNSQGQRVRVFESAGTPPEKISWDGTDDAGNIVPDGEYAFALGLLYSTGNHPMSETGTIIVDTTPPAYRFVISPQLFSPDNDGESDTMYINVEVDDRNSVIGWEIIHYRVWDDRIDYSIPFKQFSGEGKIKQTINWDGYSDPVPMSFGFAPPDAYTYRRSGNRWEVLVDSASSYTAELRATDRFRNEIQVQREYRTDILVIKTAEGLKIMINSIEFEFDKSDLLPQSFSILDRLIQILDKFPAYKVKIVGHTDAVGSDEYNQKLSERRAFSVYKYLVANDVAKERLTTEGRGETQPIDDNETEAGRARNRRVEFFLTK